MLFVRYDLAAIKKNFRSSSLALRTPNMWRYAEVLPEADPITLGEGFTPLLPSREFPNVYIKDESRNPTGSFKARGLSAAVSMAKRFGQKKLSIVSGGNAACALAAYAAAAGAEAYVFMPKDALLAHRMECVAYGAQITLIERTANGDGGGLPGLNNGEGCADITALKEPFQVEGKKTIGYEIVEQLGWRVPQHIVCPCGSGAGLTAIWKAFEEMEALGWIGHERPRIIAVQSAACAPIVKAWDDGNSDAELYSGAEARVAKGLQVPNPYGEYLVLDIVSKSGGLALAVSDEKIMDAQRQWARAEGIFASPEGAASLAAYSKLLDNKYFAPQDVVVLLNTASGTKYLDMIEGRKKPEMQPVSRSLGGIIGPY